jgi:hypothetical protein
MKIRGRSCMYPDEAVSLFFFSQQKQWFKDLCLGSREKKIRQILIARIFTQNERKSYEESSTTRKEENKRSRGSPLYQTEQNIYLNEGA